MEEVPTNTTLKLPISDSSSLPSPVPVKKGPDKAWATPPTGWVKLTIDGLFQASDRTASLGMVVCNEEDFLYFRRAVSWRIVKHH
jgi:hypothetical protein